MADQEAPSSKAGATKAGAKADVKTDATKADASRPVKAYRLKFTGSGPEYFRVWLVNLLLMLVTLGIYTPWARKRTAEYFFGHSVVARSPLEFTAETRRMVIGFFIFLGLYTLFNWATESTNMLIVGLALFAAAVAIPFLWGSSRRFRVTATRWRGLRLRFGTNWKEIYWASWPVFLIALLWFLIYALMDILGAARPQSLIEETRSFSFLGLTTVDFVLIGLGLIATWLCFVRVLYNYQKLTIERTYIGVEQGVFRATYGDFVRIWLVTSLIAVAGVMAVSLVSGAVLKTQYETLFAEEIAEAERREEERKKRLEVDEFAQAEQKLMERMERDLMRSPTSVNWTAYADELAEIHRARAEHCAAAGPNPPEYCKEEEEDEEAEGEEWTAEDTRRTIHMAVMTLLLVVLPAMLVYQIAAAYREAKQHRLVWNRSGVSDIVRFRNKLGVAGYVWLKLKNWLLTVLTIGFYRPFARVSEYRARWTSTTLHARGGASRIQNLLVIQQEGGAFADAIADFAGFDIVS